MESQKDVSDVNCEYCEKPFDKRSLLRHIGQTTACKSYYGTRFTEMKKEKTRIKVNRHREKMSYFT